MRLIVSAICIHLLAPAMALSSNSSSGASALVHSPEPLVIAHRGFSGNAPENTLPAFQLALDNGAPLIELDYHHSADGIPVVIHDSTLKRTTDIATAWAREDGKVGDYPLVRLRELDAGSWFDQEFAGTKLPTLEEAIRLIQNGSTTLIERKAGDAGTLIDLLRRMDCVDQVVVQSFDWDFIRDCRALDADLVLGALGPPSRWQGRTLESAEKTLNREFVDFLATLNVQLVVWNRAVTVEAVAHAHSLGLKVWVYTIDDPAEARLLVAEGVDGIITNQLARVTLSHDDNR